MVARGILAGMVACRLAGVVLALGLVLGGVVRASGRAVHGVVSPRLAADPARRVLTVYDANVHAAGRLVVSFRGDRAAGCEPTGQCAVKSGTMTWTPPRTGVLEIVDSGSRGKPRRQAFIDLSASTQPPASTSVQRPAADGSHTCIDAARLNEDAQLPVSSDASGGLTVGLYAAHSTFALGVPETPLDLAYGLETSGAVIDEPPPTRCGGPLPADFLPALSGRRVSLAALRRGAMTINLSGVAPFAAGGLSGTARSTIVLRVGRLRGREVQTRPAPTRISDEDRVIIVQYQVAKVAGSVGVDVLSSPSSCAGFDVCGLGGTLTIGPGPAHGKAYVIAYDLASTSNERLRRSIGLAPGKIPAFAQVFGLATWASKTASISAALDRDGRPACRDSTPLPVGALEIDVHGKHVVAKFGASDLADVRPVRDLLRTRCPGPTLAASGSGSGALATTDVPVRTLGQRTLTLRLTRGITTTAPGFTWRSRPNLTIVLRRTRVTERLVPSSAFEN